MRASLGFRGRRYGADIAPMGVGWYDDLLGLLEMERAARGARDDDLEDEME